MLWPLVRFPLRWPISRLSFSRTFFSCQDFFRHFAHCYFVLNFSLSAQKQHILVLRNTPNCSSVHSGMTGISLSELALHNRCAISRPPFTMEILRQSQSWKVICPRALLPLLPTRDTALDQKGYFANLAGLKCRLCFLTLKRFVREQNSKFSSTKHLILHTLRCMAIYALFCCVL